MLPTTRSAAICCNEQPPHTAPTERKVRRLHLTQLTLARYRNLRNTVLGDLAPLNIFVGANAQGKTNTVEAIHLCSTGRSHRTARDMELVRWGEQAAYVKARTQHADGTHIVEVGLSAQGKSVKINGACARRLGELMGHVNTVMFSPEDLGIVKAGPGTRRRFLDIHLSQIDPVYFTTLQNYNKALSQRNALLKSFFSRPEQADTIDVWDEQLARLGAQIVVRRRAFSQDLSAEAAVVHKQLCGEDLTCQYNACTRAQEPDDAYQALLRELVRNREQDIRRGATYAGPQRDDITLMVDGYDLRAYGSQGQHRSAALSLKLAVLALMRTYTGETPLLILDDVLSELDEQRGEGLLRSIGGAQTFITCAQMDPRLTRLDTPYALFTVSQGQITRQGSRPRP